MIAIHTSFVTSMIMTLRLAARPGRLHIYSYNLIRAVSYYYNNGIIPAHRRFEGSWNSTLVLTWCRKCVHPLLAAANQRALMVEKYLFDAISIRGSQARAKRTENFLRRPVTPTKKKKVLVYYQRSRSLWCSSLRQQSSIAENQGLKSGYV